MSKPEVVIAIYNPIAGKTPELEALMRKHFSILKECGLTTDRESFIGRSANGAILEIFEWISREAAQKAHDHPAVAKIWEAMAQVCDFGSLGQLPEANGRFPHFPRVF